MNFAPTAARFYFEPSPSENDACVEQEKRFFASIRLRNGVHKSTEHHRLDDVNEWLLDSLPSADVLQVMDVAVSSGITSVEWSENLRSRGIEHEILAGDSTVYTLLVSLPGGIHVLIDRAGYPLQLGLAGLGIPTSSPKLVLDLPLSALRAVSALLLRSLRIPSDAISRHENGGRTDQAAELASSRLVMIRSLALLSRQAMSFRNVQFIEDELLSPSPLEFRRRFHVLRAANILNLAYFSIDELRILLRNLRDRLRVDGLLVVCRSHAGGRNEASAFRLASDNRFSVVARLGPGSEIEDLATSIVD